MFSLELCVNIVANIKQTTDDGGKTMLNANLNEAKELIRRERQLSKNSKRPRYSPLAKNQIISLTKIMPITKIANELGVAESFVRRLKERKHVRKIKTNNEKSEVITPIKLVDIPFSFMKDEVETLTPVIKFNMPGGIVIEFFNPQGAGIC